MYYVSLKNKPLESIISSKANTISFPIMYSSPLTLLYTVLNKNHSIEWGGSYCPVGWLIMPHMVGDHVEKHGFPKSSWNNLQVDVNINYRRNMEDNIL